MKFKIQKSKSKISIQKLKLLKFSLVLLTFTFYLLTLSRPVFAVEQDLVGYSKIHPASPFYFLKAIRESLELKFAKTTSDKMSKYLEFATRRLREVRTLTGINEDLIPPTLERYSAYLNNLTDKHQKSDDFLPILQTNLITHLKVLRQIYDQVNSQRAKIFIRSTMNRLVQRADVPSLAKAPICNFFAKEASSSALNQTEQLVLLDRADKCHLFLLR